MVVSSQIVFDKRNDRYYAWGVRTGVVVISIIEIVFHALIIISAVFTSVHDYPTINYAVKWTVAVRAIIMVVCALLAIEGIRGIKPAFLIPHIVMQVINIFIMGFISGVIHVAIKPAAPSYSMVIIMVWALLTAIETCLLGVSVHGYKYLKLKKEFLVNNQNCLVEESVPMSSYHRTLYAGSQQAPDYLNFAQFGYPKAPQ